jgi:hypothetical protein
MIACLLWHFKPLSDKLPKLVGVSESDTLQRLRQALAACRTFSAATGLTKQPPSLTKSIHFAPLLALQAAMACL